MDTPTATQSEWVDASEAARIIGVTRQSVPILTAEGLLGCRAIPGTRRRYSRRDAERIARESVRPARSQETIPAQS
jgi:hypothetical protein